MHRRSRLIVISLLLLAGVSLWRMLTESEEPDFGLSEPAAPSSAMTITGPGDGAAASERATARLSGSQETKRRDVDDREAGVEEETQDENDSMDRADAVSLLSNDVLSRLEESRAIGDYRRFFALVGVPTDSGVATRVAMILDETVRDYNAKKRELFDWTPSAPGAMSADERARRFEELFDEHWSRRCSLLAPYVGSGDVKSVMGKISGGWGAEK